MIRERGYDLLLCCASATNDSSDGLGGLGGVSERGLRIGVGRAI